MQLKVHLDRWESRTCTYTLKLISRTKKSKQGKIQAGLLGAVQGQLVVVAKLVSLIYGSF
jgi:hypothetical protein